MRTARIVVAAGTWAPGTEAGRVTLAYDDRFRRRLRLDAGAAGDVLLDLPSARVLRDGDALLLEDGTLIAVAAADEPLMEVRSASPALLMRLAWHIGNRHLPARLEAARILLRRDHVIAVMLTGLGGEVRDVMAPFDPEGGAYGEAGTAAAEPHAHGHTHGHSHDHAHHRHD